SRQALGEVAPFAWPPNLTARQANEMVHRWSDALIGGRRNVPALHGGIDRNVLAVENVGLMRVVKIEESDAHVLVQPLLVSLNRGCFFDAIRAQADRLLR